MKIKKLKLFSSNIAEQAKFYSDVLGFNILKKEEQSVVFDCGQTELTFEYQEAATPCHFAFNVPSNQINESLVWLKQRVEVITHEGNEIQDFDFWKAKAIYFYDTDKNIVELIARKDLNSPSSAEFTVHSILSVSEIAIVSENNEKMYDHLLSTYGLTVFSGNKEVFTAIGDDEGLFICMDKTKRKWFPTGEDAFCSGFEVEFEGPTEKLTLKYDNEKLIR